MKERERDRGRRERRERGAASRSSRAGASGARGRSGKHTSLLAPILGSITLSVALRVIYLATAQNPFWHRLGLDLEVYDLWARRILVAPPFGGEPLSQAPFFPLALSLAYAILGTDPVRALFFHLVPAALATGALVWAAGRWRGRVAAWTAGLLASLHGPSLFYTGVLLPPAWVLGLSAAVLALGIRVVRGEAGRIGRALAGIALGLLVWAQPVALVLVLALLAFGGGTPPEAGRPRADGRAGKKVERAARLAWARGGWLLLGLAVPLCVTFGYNASKGAPALVAHNGGINLYVGNGPGATGAYARPAGMEENRDLLGLRLAARILLQETEGGVARAGAGEEPPFLDLRGADRFWWGRALTEMTTHPGRTARLYLRKLGFFFTNYEIPQVESFPFESRFSPLLRLPLPGMAVLVFGSVLGSVLLLRRDPVARWLLASVLLLACGVAVFFVTARFRIPVVPWMIVLSAGGVDQLLHALRRGQGGSAKAGNAARAHGMTASGGRSDPDPVPTPGRVTLALTLAALAALASGFAPTGIVAQVSNGQYVFRQAVIAEQKGDLAGAIDGYREALDIDPSLAKASVNLGTLLARGGNLPEARSYLERGVALDPTSGIAHQNLGQLEEAEGRADEALRRYEAAIAAEPDLVSARESAAYLLHQLARIEESRAQLQQILRTVQKGSPPELRCGTLFSLVAERRDLVPRLVKEGARPDWWASPDLLRADVLLAQRQVPRSADLYRKLLEDPGFAPYAQLVLSQLEASGVLR